MLDSSAVLALFFDEPPAKQVEQILADAADENREVFISAVNWTEVLYRVQQIQGEAGIKAANLFEHDTTVNIKPVGRELAELAAQLKVAYRLSIGDAFCAALAKEMKAVLVTKDLDFEPLKTHFKKIVWLNANE